MLTPARLGTEPVEQGKLPGVQRDDLQPWPQSSPWQPTPDDSHPPPHLADVVGRLLLATVLGALAVFVLLFITGVGGFRGGWVPAGLLGGGTGAVAAYLAWTRPDGRIAAIAALTLAGIAWGLFVADHTPLSRGRLHSAMNSVSVPAEFQKVVDSDGGIAVCFDQCPFFARTWIVSGTMADAEAAVSRILAAEGFTLGQWRGEFPGTSDNRGTEGRRGRLQVSVRLNDSRVDGPGYERVPVPAGRVGVRVTLSS